MTRELLIMRHAKSDWTIPVDDFDRPLKKRGQIASEKIALWMRKKHLIPDLVISSPAKRAIQTASILANELALDVDSIQLDGKIYAAGLNDLLSALLACSEQYQRILLVGHNPGLETLLVYLLGEYPDIPDDKLLATATLAQLTIPAKNSQLITSCAILVSITRPADLI